MKTLILTPLAEREVNFYLETAQALQKSSKLQIVFVSFFQPGNQLIKDSGFPVYDPYQVPVPHQDLAAWIPQAEKDYGIASLEKLILHEKLTFGVSDPAQVFRKFQQRIHSCEQIFEQIEKDFPSSEKQVVQELAGFMSPLALYFVARKRGWKHYFTEPSFFKGRIHFLLNDLNLHIPRISPTDDSRQAVKDYLAKAATTKLVVAAAKDSHHYKDMGLAKVFNSTNLKKILKKNYQKYVRGQKQEFEFFWNHSRRYMSMLINRYRNTGAYTSLDQLPSGQKYIYFPFHVQLDFSLTIRTPDWLDQLSLIEKILPHLPDGTVLLAKEHPASIGCLAQGKLEALLKHPQFRLLHPQVNSYDILDQCYGVVTINSKVGAEAITKGLPVFTFGNAFYTNIGFAEHFQSWTQFATVMEKWLRPNADADTSHAKWIEFLAQVWQDSFATELYDLTPTNVDKFAGAIASLPRPNREKTEASEPPSPKH